MRTFPSQVHLKPTAEAEITRELNYDPYFASRPSARERLKNKRTKADVMHGFENSMTSGKQGSMYANDAVAEDSGEENA